MAAGILTLLGRIRLLSGSRPTVVRCCGLRSRPPFSPEDEDDLESEGNEEQEIMSILKRRGEAIRFKRIKREMEPPELPERRLTWNAMEQIRYLKQEFPEEWTIQRLAAGFNVSTDNIRRVLKSKFVPSEARKMKQDAAAFKSLGQVSSTKHDQPKLVPSSKHPSQPLLAHGNSDRHLLVSQSPPLLPSPKTSDFSHIAVRTEGTQRHIGNALVPQNMLQGVKEAQPPLAVSSASPNRQEEPVPDDPGEEDWKMLDEKWDGEVLSDHDMEELANSGLENKMKVVQKGREFFDGDGNFLYRI
ncbi:PREDICTED: neugrin [Nanorana parkeri]|uniref:neugrin n=1 Tax=Nanorana parkeri TaxID=125878 RepID=UPI0008548D4C|nr:PREDICTED: neugrin [Nanorana parkeri]